MNILPTPLQPLAQYKQFILWTIRGDKKLPFDPKTAQVCSAHDESVWLTADEAFFFSGLFGEAYRVGFVFSDRDPFFFLDIDNCLMPDNTWSPQALEVLTRLPGAAVEISQSGRGLHIIGRGVCPPHACKNVPLGLELYTDKRFIALTGTAAIGDAGTDLSAYLPGVVAAYFPPSSGSGEPMEWTYSPVAEWQGIADDTELISRMCSSTSARGAFGGGCSFRDLWEGNEAALSAAYPDTSGQRAYDASSADAAMAQHLAFWTGKNCERIRALMLQSKLTREKWNREDYLPRTILKACSMQKEVFGSLPKLKATSDKQRALADRARTTILATATPEQREILTDRTNAKFWIDNRDKPVADLVTACAPISDASANLFTREITPVSGYQYLTMDLQKTHFKGCVYIQELHRILTPSGALLKESQFNATYGGYVFQIDDSGEKTTRKAWEAFTESQILHFPKAQSMCFRPTLPSGAIIEEEGRSMANAYVEIPTARTPGDATPFLDHLAKVIPDPKDRAIMLAYMAACVQHKGVKFQWAPLLQGTEGNGKTLFTRCVAYAIGKRYTHYPKAMDIDNKFNGWLLNKLFIGVEDIYVPDNRREILETLKPMITGGDGLEIQLKGVDQITADICANFILNSNHKDAIRKTTGDRRFCIFYTAQQSANDLLRDGMTGSYFPDLYNWLYKGGYAVVSDYLYSYQIPDELNPATQCHRAPETSSTQEAITESLGGVEQEILEAIEEGRPGFAGGWVSSIALDKLLLSIRRFIPPKKRRAVMNALGYDWHPVLVEGRVHNAIAMDDGKKPRLYIKKGHLACNLWKPADVARAYQEAQTQDAQSTASVIFR